MAFRFQPAGPVHAYETFQVSTSQAPEHWRRATCEEIDCEAWRFGWVTRVPAGGELEATVRSAVPGMWLTAELDGGETVFTFPPYTPCFRASQHRLPRADSVPELFVVRGGDWRGNPTGQRRVHQRPEDWAEHLHESTDRITEALRKG